MLVAFVEELGDLARLSLGGARVVRRELRARSNNPTPPAAMLRDTDAALKELANTLNRISQRPARFVATPNPIEIENRTVPPPPPRVPSALERALAGGVFASTGPKAGGYKN